MRTGGDDRQLIEEVEQQVRAWLTAAATRPTRPSAKRLAAVLQDPRGLEFTVGFVDRVVRPEDLTSAARALRELVGITPRFLPLHQRVALRLGAALSRAAPWPVVPIARAVLRRMVGHLLIDATDARLGAPIRRIRERGVDLNINLLGEAVLGRAEADRRLDGTMRLLRRPDVDYVSIKVSATVAPHSPWAHDETVAHVIGRLLPLYEYAAAETAEGRRTFINLDMEEYHDLDITLEVFTRLLDREELLGLEAGIVLQAYLPDALGAMMRLQEWAAARRARGGAPIKVRLVKGANLPMERVQSSLTGWPLATWGSKQETDTHYKRVLDYALTPERAANVHLGVAGHNLFDIAYAWILAGRRGVREHVGFEMLLGMAEGQAEAVRETVGSLLLYVPVVHPEDFDVAIAYLVRRLEEGASQENFMSAVHDLHADDALFRRERDRFVASLAALDDSVPAPRRTQDRRRPVTRPREGEAPDRFANTPDTDPSLPGNRAWARAISERIPTSTLGADLVAVSAVRDTPSVERILADTRAAGEAWGRRPAPERAALLRSAAVELERSRGELLEVAASECGKTLDQGDPEVSEAIDFLAYYADLAEELDRIDGATHVPAGLTLVVPPWNFPLAIPTGGVAAALAAGSGVVLKPAPQARRCAAVIVEAMWAAGIPREVLRLVDVAEDDVGHALIASPLVDRLILTGAYETAELFRSWRPDLPLLAETSGKNAIVITPEADLDLAVRDLVHSAFGHAGQKCSAASLAILVGSVATSRRFRDQLVDAVRSLKVGPPSDPTSQVGPLIEPAAGKLLDALTRLQPGESWLVEPRRLDDEGRLWAPGVKTGVRPGSSFHLTECFGPVLGLMSAATLSEAIELQNRVDFGLTAGLHSLDRDEIAMWIDAAQAGNAYVNRTTVGAIVRRQPFGGWKRSAVGAGTKAGGPDYLIGLCDWRPAPATSLGRPSAPVQRLLDGGSSLGLDRDGLIARGARSDASAWAERFGTPTDVSALSAERNILRHLPVPVTIRYEAGPLAELLRVLAAGVAAGAPVTVSTAAPLEGRVADLVGSTGATYVVQDAATWTATLLGPEAPHRVRLLGGDRATFTAQSWGRAEIALYAQPVVEAGRIELLTFLHEQAIAITAHRFGSPTTLVDGLLPGR